MPFEDVVLAEAKKGMVVIVKICIAGDLVPTQKNEKIFCEGNIKKNIDKKFNEIWSNADYRIFNLETPLGENYKKICKNGPNLIAKSKTINGIKELNPSLVCMANNHILDYGVQGLENTQRVLSKANIEFTGIINNVNEDMHGFIFEKDNIRVGIYNTCENEFSGATINDKGANVLFESKAYLEILRMKKECDCVIVIYHAGKECYRYPSPDLQRICRAFIEFGADFVVTQHSHCIGCYEVYKNKTIVYGQGNFIFDDDDNEFWNTSLLIILNIEKQSVECEYIPMEKCNSLIKVSEKKRVLSDFFERSEEIKDQNKIFEKYNEFSRKNLNSYLHICNGKNFLSRVLNVVLKRKYFIKKYKIQDCLSLYNIVKCEAHRELFLNGLKQRIDELKNG